MRKKNLFIENVMNTILQPLSYNYMQQTKLAEQMTSNELYQNIIQNINIIINSNESENSGTTIFATPGCSHNVRDGHFCGCSFCDWNDSNVADIALVATLRKRDPNLYRKMQVNSFKALRGLNKEAKRFEEFAIHDCFDDQEISEEERQYLFEEASIFSTKPIIGLVQVRAESVTKKKIEQWKSVVRKQLTLGVGIETGDEWIRNHWLNKDLKDEDILNAVKLAHDSKCKVSANLLMMLPGLNDKQNVQLLVQSVKKVHEYQFDSIMISPLVVKKYTIQNYLNYNNTVSDQIQHNLFLLYKMLIALSNLDNSVHKKLMFSSLNFNNYFEQLDKQNEMLCKEIFHSLLNFGAMKDLNKTIEKIKFVLENEYLSSEIEQYNSLDGIETLQKSIKKSAEVLIRVLFNGDDREYQKSVLKKELEEWDEIYAKV